MRRCENCNGTKFRTRADRHIHCDVFFDTSNGKEEYKNLDDLESPDWYGECICTQCGKVYRTWRDVPDDNSVTEHWESPALRKIKRGENNE